MQQVKVLLVQLASNGDCLFVTTIAKQIKEVDYPGCHLTWLIGSKCSQVIKNNPYIDEIVEIPFSMEDRLKERYRITEHIENIGGYKAFDKIFITDFTKENYKNWYGTTRSSLFRSYESRLKINPQPLIYLTDEEQKNVAAFCREHDVTPNTYNILFECSPQSGQSQMTFLRAKTIAEEITAQNSGIKFILTSSQSFTSENFNIIDGSTISWRENAELANYCNLLVGSSSGISWLCTSNWTKPIEFIQIINPYYFGGRFSASMKMDFKFFGIDTERLLELNNANDKLVKKCILAAANNNFELVQKKYGVTFYSAFFNRKFLTESKLAGRERLWYSMGYFMGCFFALNVYRYAKEVWLKVIFLFKLVKPSLKRRINILLKKQTENAQ